MKLNDNEISDLVRYGTGRTYGDKIQELVNEFQEKMRLASADNLRALSEAIDGTDEWVNEKAGNDLKEQAFFWEAAFYGLAKVSRKLVAGSCDRVNHYQKIEQEAQRLKFQPFN